MAPFGCYILSNSKPMQEVNGEGTFMKSSGKTHVVALNIILFIRRDESAGTFVFIFLFLINYYEPG